MSEKRLVRVCVRLLGSLVTDSMDVSRVLRVCVRVVHAWIESKEMQDDSWTVEASLEALDACSRVIAVDPEKLYHTEEGDTMRRAVEYFLDTMIMSIKHLENGRDHETYVVRGFVTSLGAHPVAALDTLTSLVKSKRIGDSIAKACLMGCVDHAYRFVAEYEPDLAMPREGTTSVLENAVCAFGGLSMADCQRKIQELMVLVPISVEEGSRLHEVIARLTEHVLMMKRAKKKSEEELGSMEKSLGATGKESCVNEIALKDFEEGELLVSAYNTDANKNRRVKDNIEGIIPIKVSKTLKVMGLSDSMPTRAVWDACDKFTGVKEVERDKKDRTCMYVTCTSMPGAVRCYEAMFTRGRQFWEDLDDQWNGVPQVDLAPCSSQTASTSTFIFMPGVEDVEQEEKIKGILKQANVALPTSLTPLNVGMKGVILSFETAKDAENAFASLGGIEERPTSDIDVDHAKQSKRDREDVQALEENERKKHRSDEQIVWSGQILRNKQRQCFVHARLVEPAHNDLRDIDDAPFDWPDNLEVNQRADIKYICNTLISSVPRNNVLPALICPANQESEKGLAGFDAYLRGKNRAGVVFLPEVRMYKKTLYLVPISDDVCHKLDIDSRNISLPAIIGMIVYHQTD